MLNPAYLVNITYQPAYVVGHSLTYSVATGTYSLNVYSTPLYVATMPEALLTATGTSYTTALASLLILATARGDSPLQLLFDNGMSVSIGTNTPDASALLELSSTTKGFAPPRMTTLERDAIVNPVISLLIFNLTTSLYNYWNGLNWIQITQSAQIGASVNGLGSAIQVGSVGFSIPAFSGNITSWSLVGDVSGDVVFDVRINGVSIVGAGNKPTIVGSTDNAENVSGWTSVAIVEGTYVEFVIESVNSFKNINLVLNVS